MSKILIASMPVISVDVPPLGPALIRSIADQKGWQSKLLDFNLYLYQKNKQLANWIDGNISLHLAKQYVKIFRSWKKQIDAFDPDLLALSVFSYHSHCHTTLFCKWLRKHASQLPILIGGAGAISENYGAKMFSQNLVDHYIVGEGEEPFRALLDGALSYPGLNNTNFAVLQDFSQVPAPNFDGLPLDEYEYPMGRKSISIEGSRGCVRNCSFCDIKKIWKKYKYKDGSALAHEMIQLANRYSTYNFWFNDSLINGSLKVYRQFVQTLADYNALAEPEKQISWSAQYIVRSVLPSLEDDIKLTKQSGCHTLAIGIESGSEAVRAHMGKPFTNQDIETTFSLLRKHDIKIFLLMIIGYPTETAKDFKDTIDLFTRYQKYAVDGSISGVNLGGTLAILPDTPLDQVKHDLGIKNSNNRDWSNQHSNLQLRIARRLYAQEHASQLGYRFFDSEKQLQRFKNMILHPVVEQELESDVHG